MEKYDPNLHCLEMVRPGFGLKDAPRIWAMRLDMAMRKLGYAACVSDSKIYCKWNRPGKVPAISAIVSAHVDDLKGATEPGEGERLLKALAAEFGELKIQRRKFEHTGIWHEQDADFSIRCSQDHYVKQLRLMPLDSAGEDHEEVTDTEAIASFWSLLGGVAWTAVTRGDVLVHIAHLQRQTAQRKWNHLKQINTLVRWIKRKSCVMKFVKIDFPWTVYVFPDSAFRADEPDCLAIRASVTVLGCNLLPGGGRAAVCEFYTRKNPRVLRSTFSTEAAACDDAVSSASVIRGLFAEICDGPHSARQLAEKQETGNLSVDLETVSDNKGFVTAVSAVEIKPPAEPHLLFLLLAFRNRINEGMIRLLWWIDTRDMISDCLTKGGLNREPILEFWRSGTLPMKGDAPVCFPPSRVDRRSGDPRCRA